MLTPVRAASVLPSIVVTIGKFIWLSYRRNIAPRMSERLPSLPTVTAGTEKPSVQLKNVGRPEPPNVGQLIESSSPNNWPSIKGPVVPSTGNRAGGERRIIGGEERTDGGQHARGSIRDGCRHRILRRQLNA